MQEYSIHDHPFRQACLEILELLRAEEIELYLETAAVPGDLIEVRERLASIMTKVAALTVPKPDLRIVG